MVSIDAFEVVNVQRHQGVVDEALEEFVDQLGIERTQRARGELHIHVQTGTARKIDHHPAQGFV